jgi:hypothetical protein
MGVSDQCHAQLHFIPGKELPVPDGQEAGWATKQVWMQRLEMSSHYWNIHSQRESHVNDT